MATTCVTSTMFLTALAPNLLAIEILQKTAKISISLDRMVHRPRAGGHRFCFCWCRGSSTCSIRQP